jgi:hypothetical protein
MSSTPSPESEAQEAAERQPAAVRGSRPPIHARCPEIRTRVDPALYGAVVREASAQGITVAECLRRILEAHYARLATNERELGAVVEQVAAEVSTSRHESRLMVGLLASMLELAFKALLVRLPAAGDADLAERVRQAGEGHEKWTQQLARRLADGSAEELLALVFPSDEGRR